VANTSLVGLPTGRMHLIPATRGYVFDTTSRCELAQLSAGTDTLHLSSTGPLDSDSSVQTSFGGFQLNSTISMLAAFSVKR
jgi:hypothetical protein